MYSVCGLRLGPNLGVWPKAERKLFVVTSWENARACCFCQDIYGQTAVVTPILRLRLNVQI